MKFTINWLKRHLDTEASDETICETLTNIGLELEGFEDKAAQFGSFKVAFVESAEKHPDADKLKVCKVRTQDGVVQVVCGAPNARAGMKGIFAPSGTYIPGLDVILKPTKIRGVESNGMLVSEREMCLSDEHDGIIEVDESYEIGTPMAEIFGLDEKVVEIGLTPNRADCAGVRGIARDLAAAGLGVLKDQSQDVRPMPTTFPCPVSVKIEDDGCRVFYGRLIRGVTNGPSPEWLQNALKNIGLRPISALVDITNFMTMDQARPLHVFDANKLTGGITVRSTRAGEQLDALNDKSYTVNGGAIGITDESGLIGLGGIVGGTSTAVDEGSVDVFIEAAYFDPMRIARTGRDLSVQSDARYRFERGVDPAFTKPGIEMATRLILEICGDDTTQVSTIVQAGQDPVIDRIIPFNPAFTKKLCGIEIDSGAQLDILRRLGFGVDGHTVSVPSWRGDVEGAADLVEEITRIYGFEHIEPVSVRSERAVTASAETVTLERARLARAAMTSRGFYECVTWSFMPKDLARHFGSNDNTALTLSNPISSELDQMRPSILPNLIAAAGRNADRGYEHSALCEVGPVFRTSRPEGQDYMAAGLRQGEYASKHWAVDKVKTVDAYIAKADVLRVLAACGAPAANAQISRNAPAYYHPGRSGTLGLGKNVIAQFGEIHPAILDAMDVKGPMAGFEVFLDNIPASRNKSIAKKLIELSHFQPVRRDFAFVVKDDVVAEDVLRAIIAVDKRRISAADIFDIYDGQGIEDGHKSLAVSVTIQPSDATLSEQDIEGIMNAIIEAVSKKCGGILRGV